MAKICDLLDFLKEVYDYDVLLSSCCFFSTGQWDPSRLPFRMPCIDQKYLNDKTELAF